MLFDEVRKAFDTAAEWLHTKQKFTADMLAEKPAQNLMQATNDVLQQAVSRGITHEVPEELTAALEQNTFIFSGFKTYHELREASTLLKDENGGFKPFERFLSDVQKINNTYNRNYLHAEYNHAVQSTQMAVKWHDFEQDGDRYDLQYRTANDGKVREEHAILHNTTLPPSDPFWDKYLPPNGWNCRCTVVQVRKGKYPTSDPELAMQRGDNCTSKPKQQIFRFNPGKSMKVFPEKHPYLPKGCGNCSLKLAYSKNSDVCQACKAIANIAKEKQERIRQNRAEYERLKADHDYKDVKFDPKTGGLKATHVGHIDHTNEKSIFMGLNPTQLENACQNQLFRMGHSAVFCDESIQTKKGENDTSLDLLLDGKRMDIASVTKDVINYRNVFNGKNSQLHRYNHLEYVDEKADAVCFYFHEPKMFSEQKVYDGMQRLKEMKYIDAETGKEKSPNVIIKHVYCVVRGSDKLHKYDFE